MNRAHSTNTCPDCKQQIQRASTCTCGKNWNPERSVKGTLEEEQALKQKGFNPAQNSLGDQYYIGPFGQLLYLYGSDEWSGDPASACTSLEDYLAQFQSVA
jgi:hypothetical protein